ncbi:MAG: hypothetical protein ACLFP8_03600 [Alphaproteobacteria bacterium]
MINTIRNLVIFTLILLCSYMLLIQPAKTPQPSNCVDKIEKRPHEELINTATLHGLSLNTPVEIIDSIIAQTPFTCRTSVRQTQNNDGQTHQEKFWRCSHESLQIAEIKIDAKDNKIQRISRNGPSEQTHINNAIEQLLRIRSKMQNFKNFSMSQSEYNTNFNLQHREGKKIMSSMSYNIRTFPQMRIDNKSNAEYAGMLRVTLTRR